MTTADVIALVAAIAAVASAVIAIFARNDSKDSAIAAKESATVANTANEIAKSANVLSERIAKRACVIELHQAWQGVNRFDPKKPIYPDAIKGSNALDLTASLWNHDVLEKGILFQSYWKPFKDLYGILSICDLPLQDGRRIRDMISPAVTLAFKQMEEMELKGVNQTAINSK